MDTTSEIRNEQIEYVAPAIVDYGDIVEITAAAASGGHTDVPINTNGPDVFS